jgi:alpha-1,6-mannosyltransferase
VAFAVTPPLLSHDVYSYVDYARLAVRHGLNPYLHPPSAAPADPVYAEVAWRSATSVYGPLFTLATYPLAWLSVGAAVAALKALAAASLLAVAALVARLAPARGVEPLRAATFVALNPLALVHVVGGAHNDGIAMLAGMAGVAGALSARQAGSGAAFVAALAIKAPAAIAAPFALLGAKHGRGRLLLGAALALATIALASQAAFGPHWLDALGGAGASQNRTSHLSIPTTAARLSGLDPDLLRAAALVLYAGLLAHLLAWTWRGGDWLRASAWASLGLLLASAWLLPWYVIWALPLAALSRDRPLQLVVLALTAYQLGARLPT